jgi:hypothetical protein
MRRCCDPPARVAPRASLAPQACGAPGISGTTRRWRDPSGHHRVGPPQHHRGGLLRGRTCGWVGRQRGALTRPFSDGPRRTEHVRAYWQVHESLSHAIVDGFDRLITAPDRPRREHSLEMICDGGDRLETHSSRRLRMGRVMQFTPIPTNEVTRVRWARPAHRGTVMPTHDYQLRSGGSNDSKSCNCQETRPAPPQDNTHGGVVADSRV